ncbi:hypothetical protein DL766_008935 [Monosporascus sp. MC13-8B]|nr:hypothetical protein DL766_008935 [Monosporascus sp. MC13-8B]
MLWFSGVFLTTCSSQRFGPPRPASGIPEAPQRSQVAERRGVKIPPLDQPEAGRQHPAFKYIDAISKGSGKITELERILGLAAVDDAAPQSCTQTPPAGPTKKHVCLFTERPGIAALLAMYADRHWAGRWEVKLVLGRRPSIARSGSSPSPTRGSCPPYSSLPSACVASAKLRQARGRIHRIGQRFPAHFYVLFAEDHAGENLINTRYKIRDEAFGNILASTQLDR